MGYVSQNEIEPIAVKEYLLKNWQQYDIADTKEEFLAVLNILQACGESLDSLHSTYFNGNQEFCDIYHGESWDSMRDIVHSLYEFCTFYTEQQFIDAVLDRREDFDSAEEYVEEMRREASDLPEDFCDTQISKTEDGYVIRVWY